MGAWTFKVGDREVTMKDYILLNFLSEAEIGDVGFPTRYVAEKLKELIQDA